MRQNIDVNESMQHQDQPPGPTLDILIHKNVATLSSFSVLDATVSGHLKEALNKSIWDIGAKFMMFILIDILPWVVHSIVYVIPTPSDSN